jgi:hypothetical protein
VSPMTTDPVSSPTDDGGEKRPPLGIADLTSADPLTHTRLFATGYWTWCRRHERAEHSSSSTVHGGGRSHVQDCIPIGPFMSRDEAERLDGWPYGRRPDSQPPLGMGIEP